MLLDSGKNLELPILTLDLERLIKKVTRPELDPNYEFVIHDSGPNLAMSGTLLDVYIVPLSLKKNEVIIIM